MLTLSRWVFLKQHAFNNIENKKQDKGIVFILHISLKLG